MQVGLAVYDSHHLVRDELANLWIIQFDRPQPHVEARSLMLIHSANRQCSGLRLFVIRTRATHGVKPSFRAASTASFSVL